MKKRYRMTEEERVTHEEAVRLRKMTDIQLVQAFRNAGGTTQEPDTRLENLLEGLERGDVKGIKGGTVFKIAEYAKERRLIN